MKVLVTGFEPFGGETINPAYEAVMQLKEAYGRIQVVKVSLPVVFHKSINILESLIEQHNPDVILCIGQAGGRAHISVERIGINCDDARMPDNEGQAPVDVPIRDNGPAAYFSSLPIKAITQAIQMKGIPAAVSNTAGTYVCNHILYGLMDILTQKYPHKRGGFIHVPYATQQVVNTPNTPSMSLSEIIIAIETAILSVADYEKDIILSAGTTC